MRSVRNWGWVGLVMTAAPLLMAGCAIEIDDGGGDGDGGGDSGVITITVVNQTNTTLDPEIYISATPVGIDELFGGANKFTLYGVGTLGLLGPNASDTFTISCEQARVIGTNGGRFGDNLNSPDGMGRQIVLTQDLSVFCGGALTFVYSRAGSGFDTTFAVTP
jgi:hypothetical protein